MSQETHPHSDFCTVMLLTYLGLLIIVSVHIESLPRRRCFIVMADNVLVDEHVSNKRFIALSCALNNMKL